MNALQIVTQLVAKFAEDKLSMAQLWEELDLTFDNSTLTAGERAGI
jgi:hypothetical protein